MKLKGKRRVMTLKNRLLFFLVCLFFTGWAVTASAQMTKLNVGFGAISAEQLPAWVAKEAGIFEKNGLDSNLIFFTGGSTAVLALVSGDVPISQVAGNGVIYSALGGSDLVLIAGGTTSLNYWLMGRPGIKTADQLRGGSVAISRFGSATDFIARYMLPRIGLTPGKDVSIVQVGSAPTRVDAVMTGRVQAVIVNPPLSFIAQRRGMTVIADSSKMGLAVQQVGVATTRKFIREHPDIVRKYVKAQVEAVHRIHTDKEGIIKILAKRLGGSLDRDVLEKSWEDIARDGLLPRKQYPTLEGIKTLLDQQAETDPKARTAKPEDFVDSTFIRELDKSGFIDALYRQK